MTFALVVIGTVGAAFVVGSGVALVRAVVGLGALAVTADDDPSRKGSSIAFAIWFSIDSALVTMTGAALIWFVARAHRRMPVRRSAAAVTTVVIVMVVGLWVVGSPMRAPATAAGLALVVVIALIRRGWRPPTPVALPGPSP